MAISPEKNQEAPLEPVIESVLAFDGKDDFITCPEGIVTSSYTKEAWVKLAEPITMNRNILSGQQHALYRPSSGCLASGHNGQWGFVKDSSISPANTWFHVAVTYDSQTKVMALYRDGQLVSQASDVPPFNLSDRTLTIGSHQGSSLFKGQMAEARIWNKALSQTEINSHLSQRLVGNEPGLVGYWPLNEGTGTLAHDNTSNANHGTIHGNPTWEPSTLSLVDATPSEPATAPPNSVLAFDGKDDFVELPPASIPSGKEITCSFWAYGGAALPKANSVIEARSQNNQRILNIHLIWNNSIVYFDCGNSGENFASYDRLQKRINAAECQGKWTHWAFTKNATTGAMNIYFNGELWHQETGKTIPIPPTATARLGSSLDSQFYPGNLAEVQLWNRERTQAEIQQDMPRRLRGDEPGLVGYWPLNEGTGTLAHDNTSNANHGTIHGNPTWEPSTLSLVDATPSEPATAPPNSVHGNPTWEPSTQINQMTDAEKPQQPSEEIGKRPNYFAGQYLLEDDFKSEQNYHINSLRRHNRLLHVSGIAEGLNVTNSHDLTVKISAGTAFDSQGRQIILQEEKDVDLEQEANNKNPIQDGDYTLSIRYSEQLTDKQGDDEFTSRRVQEKPVFVLSSASEKPEDTIAVAKLTIKEKKVTEIAQDVRWYSGINIPTEDGRGVTLRGKVGTSNQAILDGSLSITGGLTISGLAYLHSVHIVGSLQLGNVQNIKPRISVNKIVNEIPEGGTATADSELPTVKAVVDYAGAMSNKTGDSASDFNAANLSVVTLTINQGVTLSAPKGQADKLAILEGNLSISGNMKIVGTCEISASTDIVGDLRVFKSLQIGNGNDTQAVNRIVNRINESGNPDPANEKALPTVKAAVEYADKKAKRNGDIKENFTAAHLTVTQMTINNKEITAIHEKIEEREEDSETGLPTSAAVKAYVDSSRETEVKMEYKWNEEEKCGELEVKWEARSPKVIVPITMKKTEKMQIIPTGIDPSRVTIILAEEVKDVKVERSDRGLICKMEKIKQEKERSHIEEKWPGINFMGYYGGLAEKVEEIVRVRKKWEAVEDILSKLEECRQKKRKTGKGTESEEEVKERRKKWLEEGIIMTVMYAKQNPSSFEEVKHYQLRNVHAHGEDRDGLWLEIHVDIWGKIRNENRDGEAFYFTRIMWSMVVVHLRALLSSGCTHPYGYDEQGVAEETWSAVLIRTQ